MNIAFYTQGTLFNGRTIDEKGLGGSESALCFIARALHSLGHNVSVFNNCDHPGDYDGIRYSNYSELVAYSRSNNIDICIFSRFYEPIAEVRVRARVLWLHDIASTPYYQDAIPVLNSMVSRYFFISKWQQQGFQRAFPIPASLQYLTRNGVEPKHFSASVQREPAKLIYVNTPYRGLDVLLQLFPAIRRAVPEAELFLFTGMALYGSQFAAWEQRLAPLYDLARSMEAVHLCAPLPKRALAAELLSARLALYPSHFPECCSVASLECQAAGTPMVTSALAGLQDTIIDGFTSVLIPVDDTERISHSPLYQARFINQCIRLLNDDLSWRKLSDNAKNHINKRFTWRTIALEWIDEFQKILATPG